MNIELLHESSDTIKEKSTLDLLANMDYTKLKYYLRDYGIEGWMFLIFKKGHHYYMTHFKFERWNLNKLEKNIIDLNIKYAKKASYKDFINSLKTSYSKHKDFIKVLDNI